MITHVLWVSCLYALLTMVRAPKVWGINLCSEGSHPWTTIEPRVSANLSNQFEWPVFFHIACMLFLANDLKVSLLASGLAWLFVLGRLAHSLVQVCTSNIRLRGLVFMVNFLAVLGLWAILLIDFIDQV